MYEVKVTARKGQHEVVETASGNTRRTVDAAASAVARDFEHDGYTTSFGKVVKVTDGPTVVAQGRDGGVVVVAQTRRVDLTDGS